MMKVLKKILWIILVLFLAIAFICIGYYIAVTKNVTLNPEKLLLSEKSVLLYDKDGERIAASSVDSIRQTVAYEHIPTHTKQAFVDTEDKRFYTHNGFDYRRIIKAAIGNLRSHSFKQGASTISQQLVKNTHLSQEKTLKRKLQEWKLTRILEKQYTKEEILERYLSVIYFGHHCFGLRSAADFYFGKTPEELDLADSAILAGLVKSPNHYSPFKNAEKCEKRKQSVLKAMLKNGSITEQEMQAAIEKPLPQKPTNSGNFTGYTHFVFDELSALAALHGFTVGGNIRIFTNMDKEAQQCLEKTAEEYTQTDKAFCIFDVQSHACKAYLSSVGNLCRLPGSLLKPLLVYAPALEENYISPATPVLDEKINYRGYAPNNYDKQFHGYVSVRDCVAKSYNIPAVKILESVGVEKSVSYLDKLGLHVEKDDYSLALALGGMKKGYGLHNLVAAYGALANNGVYHESAFISKIVIDEHTVYERKAKGTQVFSPETAYLMTDMLQTTAQTGTAKKLRSLPFPIAAKTGTVGTENGNTDAYALSYTTRDVVGVWLGNADNQFISCTGGGLPCNFLLQINEQLHSFYQSNNQTIAPFTKPENIIRIALDKTSYDAQHKIALADEIAPVEYTFYELFKKQSVPLQRADLFSNPNISPPSVCYQNGKVIITFNEKPPDFYQYKIERFDLKKHVTLYTGKHISVFTDESVEKNKRYYYTVTPIYKDRQGQPVALPTVSTSGNKKTPENTEEILQKDWWDY